MRLFFLLSAWSLALLGSVSCGGSSSGVDLDEIPPPPGVGDEPAFPLVDHIDQHAITDGSIEFDELFFFGDELFEAQYNSLDGVGILRLPDGTPFPQRFTRVPPGGGRFSGPNAQSCEACHNQPFGTGGGEVASNVIQDPAMIGIGPFNVRNPTSLFGSAVLQRLAEEMTDELHGAVLDGIDRAEPGGDPLEVALTTKSVSFGSLTVSKDSQGSVTFDLQNVEGIDPDLVLRPYGWKGNIATLRDFTRTAADNEMGMQPEELAAKVGEDPDPDGDTIEGEFSVGDITALTIYIGAQEIPQPLERLVRDGYLPPPTPESSRLIARGEELFDSLGCAVCHIPELHLQDVVFEEPTLRGNGAYFDHDIDAEATGLDPNRPFRFDLILEGDFPRLEPHPDGGARVRLFSDLKRHNMGRVLADEQETSVRTADGDPLLHEGAEVTIGTSEFLTAELWGVGNTGPWLHDGRAASLFEAILFHGEDQPPEPGHPDRSEAQESRTAFLGLADEDQLAVVEFLKSLLHFSIPEDE